MCIVRELVSAMFDQCSLVTVNIPSHRSHSLSLFLFLSLCLSLVLSLTLCLLVSLYLCLYHSFSLSLCLCHSDSLSLWLSFYLPSYFSFLRLFLFVYINNNWFCMISNTTVNYVLKQNILKVFNLVLGRKYDDMIYNIFWLIYCFQNRFLFKN